MVVVLPQLSEGQAGTQGSMGHAATTASLPTHFIYFIFTEGDTQGRTADIPGVAVTVMKGNADSVLLARVLLAELLVIDKTRLRNM